MDLCTAVVTLCVCVRVTMCEDDSLYGVFLQDLYLYNIPAPLGPAAFV